MEPITFGLPGQQNQNQYSTVSNYNNPINISGAVNAVTGAATGAASTVGSAFLGLGAPVYSRTYGDPMFANANSSAMGVNLNQNYSAAPAPYSAPTQNTPQATAPTQGPVQSMSQIPAPYPTGGSSTAPVPTPTVAPTPTIGETLNGIKTEALRVQDILNQQKAAKAGLSTVGYDKYPTYAELNPAINEKQIQRNQMKLFQKEIDATNKVYGDLLNTERLAGQGRLGTQTAMAARGGLLGSDFGEAQRQNQEGFNSQAQQAVQNERLAKIGTIMGTMRKAVSDEIENKRTARTEDAKSYISYIAGAKTRKQENLKLAASALIDSGIDPNTMTPDELAAIGKEANLSAQDILMQYRQQKAEQEAAAAETALKTKKTNSEIGLIDAKTDSEGFFNLGEGSARYDREGNMIASRAKTNAPGTGVSSDKVYSSKNLPGDVRTDLLDDIQNSAAALDGSLSVEQLATNYPEVDIDTLQSFYDTFYTAPEEQSGGADGSIWTFWD